jgi:hypothetical protein
MTELNDLPDDIRNEILMKFNEHKSSGYLSMMERSSRYLRGSSKQGSMPADN